MSLINIINESFDKRNKSILTESKLTQLRKAFGGEADDYYDTEELLSSIFPQFARKAYKIVKNHGYSGVFSEIDTQGDLGDDFFYANKDGKSYMGSYNYQQELDDITEIVLFGKATTYKELIDDLAEWYANLILSKLEFDSDEEWDESEWVISEGYTKSSKSKVTKNKALHESLTDQDKGHIVTELARLMDKSGKDLEDVLYDLSYIYNDENWVPIIGRFIDDDSPDLDAVDDFIGDELSDDSLDIYDHVRHYKKYITDPEILKKYGKKPNYVTQLKTAFKRVDDTYDLSVLVDDLMYGFYEKTRKILASKGFTNFSSEPSTQNMMGKDFFWAEKDGVKYEGSYDFETELEDISDFVINSNATTRKDLFNELAEWYADFVLSTLEPMEDDDDDDLDENIFIKKQKRKSQKIKEAIEKVYKYIIVDPDDPENFMLVKSGTKLGSNDFDWNFLDITDKHGKGIITWDDEYINFRNSKSPEELDEIYRQALVKYLSGLDRNHQLDNIKDEYIVKEDLMDLDLIDEDDFLDLPDPGSGEEVIEAYREDKTLKDTYLSSLVSDFLNYSYVDNDSSSASQYVDIDDLNQYVDYKDFSDDGNEDKNNDSLDDEAKIEKLKHLDHIPDKFFADSQIKSIVIPDNIKSIGDHAFEWCDFLSQITIPTSVVKIGSGAFYGNEDLKTVTYKGTRAEWWNKIDFADDWDDECYIRKIKCTDGILSL